MAIPTVCTMPGKCFAKKDGNCRILNKAYSLGEKCKFQKERCEWTNGKHYPYVNRSSICKDEGIEQYKEIEK